MAFWKSMTAGQMCELMHRLDEPGWKEPGQNPGPDSGKGEQFFLNGQYYIAQGQFAGLPEKLKSGNDLMEPLNFVRKFRVSSLLREYARGEDQRKVKPFLGACRRAFLEDGQTAESAL